MKIFSLKPNKYPGITGNGTRVDQWLQTEHTHSGGYISANNDSTK